MVTYAQNELASSTDISKQFGRYLSNISNGAIEKMVPKNGAWPLY